MESSPEPMSVGEAWFKRRRAAGKREREPEGEHKGEEDDADLSLFDVNDDELDDTAVRKLGADLGWAMVLGGIGGGAGGAAMLLTAGRVAERLRLDVDVVRTIGGTIHLLAIEPYDAGMGVAIGIGLVLGVLLGGLLRYSLRLIARVLAAPLLAAVLWTLVHAFLFKSFAPRSLGALPFAPMVIGAAVYGLCIAVLRPPRAKTV
jgi:hypothetical protein